MSREWLAVTLLPDSEETQARQNLRNLLLSLRQSLGTEASRIVSPSRDSLSLNLAGADVDVTRFDRAIKDGSEARLREAISSHILRIQLPTLQSREFFFFATFAFLAGFNERWANVLFGKAEQTLGAQFSPSESKEE